MSDQDNWRMTMELRTDLWPQYAPASGIEKMWLKHFRHRNQIFLREAMERVRLKYASDIPKMAWFESAYGDVLSEQRVQAQDAAIDEKAGYSLTQAQLDYYAEERQEMIQDLRGCGADQINRGRRRVSDLVADPGNQDARDYDNNNPDPERWSPMFAGMMWAACCGPRAGQEVTT